MEGEPHETDHCGQQRAVERASELASRQFGALSRAQLIAAGVSEARIRSWLRSGRLHRCHRAVYVWGRPELSTEGELAAALLHAGPGAALASLTALWWQQLLNRRPEPTLIASPRRCRPVQGIRVTHVPGLSRHLHNHLPVVPLPEALLAAAPLLSRNALRLVLARAEYERLLDRPALEAVLRTGRPGTPSLRAAVDAHLPALAACANERERDFVLPCERERLPIPAPNARVGRYRPDMLWREQRLIVEIDGRGAHSTPAQLGADARRQAELERLGYTVIRFPAAAVSAEAEGVGAAVRQRLGCGRSIRQSGPPCGSVISPITE
jgi:hypothetical protein